MTTQTNNHRLYRSRTDRMVSGVCGGLGHYFDIDPVIVRLVFALTVLAGGLGLLAYIILAIVLPEEPVGGANMIAAAPADAEQRARRGREIGGLILLAFGVYFLAANMGWLGWLGWLNWDLLWPVALIALGLVLLLRRQRSL